MICSFTIYLKPLSFGEKIKKYKNYDYFIKELKIEFTDKELKKVVITNFLTKDNYIEDKKYSIKISALDSGILIKLFQFFFLKKIGEERIKIGETEFAILNIYNSNKYARQLNEESDIEISEDRLRVKIITPIFFKIGNRFIATNDINLILKNIEKKLKNSNILDIEDYLGISKYSSKIEMLEDYSREVKIEKEVVGKVGEIIYDISSLDDKEKREVIFLLKFAFFSGIGYMTEKGYGQIETI